MEKYSILMTVYKNDSVSFLQDCIDSMLNQTIKTDDFIIICDGPITEKLKEVLYDYKNKNKNIIKIIELEKNVGLGKALAIGVMHCKNNLIARIDDDDISHLDRCEKQLKFFNKNPNIDIISSYVNEFDDDNGKTRIKKVPITHEEIIKYSKKRNPFNHSAVMLKKDSLLKCGNYSEMRTNQDVDTWVRMLNNGCRGYNIPEPLVEFRFDKGTYKRRKDLKNIKLLLNVWKNFYKKGYCSYLDYLYVLLVQIVILIIPTKLLSIIYDKYR